MLDQLRVGKKARERVLSSAVVEQSLERIVRQYDPFYTQLWNSLTAIQQKALVKQAAAGVVGGPHRQNQKPGGQACGASTAEVDPAGKMRTAQAVEVVRSRCESKCQREEKDYESKGENSCNPGRSWSWV